MLNRIIHSSIYSKIFVDVTTCKYRCILRRSAYRRQRMFHGELSLSGIDFERSIDFSYLDLVTTKTVTVHYLYYTNRSVNLYVACVKI